MKFIRRNNLNCKNKFFPSFYLSFILLTSLPFCIFSSAQEFDISARSAYVYIPEADIVVYEKNASTRRPIASTTKIMTALVALENSLGDDVIKISSDAVGIEGTSAYLREGDEFTVNDLIYAHSDDGQHHALQLFGALGGQGGNIVVKCYFSLDHSEDQLRNEGAIRGGKLLP